MSAVPIDNLVIFLNPILFIFSFTKIKKIKKYKIIIINIYNTNLFYI